jgi:neutral ceramidase
LRVGTAKIDITPPPGIELSGYVLREQPSLGIHDPLYARAIVMENDGRMIAIVSCDLLALGDDSVRAIRAIASKQTAMPPSHIMLSCTHTHSGPATIFLRNCGAVNRPWLVELQKRVAHAVIEAAKGLTPASCSIASTRLELAVDRCAQRGADLPSSSSYLGIIHIISSSKDPLAMIVHYACHPVVLDHTNRHVSADYPGALIQRIEHEFDGRMLTMFLNGACGNLNPAVAAHTWEATYEFGNMLATAALGLLGSAKAFSCMPLRSVSEVLELSIVVPPVEELRALEAEYASRSEELAASDDRQAAFARAFLDWARETHHIVETRSHPYNIPMEIQVLGLGDMRIVGIGGEVFSQLGEEIERTHKGPVWVCGCTNGDVGYLPPRKIFSTKCYEVADAYKFYGNFQFRAEVPDVVIERGSRAMQSLA